MKLDYLYIPSISTEIDMYLKLIMRFQKGLVRCNCHFFPPDEIISVLHIV